jgi:hypothetical protein
VSSCLDLPANNTAPTAPALPLDGLRDSREPLLQDAWRAYLRDAPAAAARIAAKAELLGHYDVPQITRAVNICFWSRSGSMLLASYFDSHDHVLLLPSNRGDFIYQFLREYAGLSLWEKLVLYPAYAASCYDTMTSDFFEGDYPIAAPEYYAAVQALYARYGEQPRLWQDTRLRFFQFLFVAYAVALGRRCATPRPLLLYAQHYTHEERARAYVEDFPDGRFIHTIRDPISALDSWFDRHTVAKHPPDYYASPAVETVRELLMWDRAHSGMEDRTRAIRFEDLHLAPAATMQRLATWLSIPYHPSLIDSTFNGTPFVFESGGVRMVGAIPANARRRSKNLDAADRALFSALLYANFRAWNYPCPRVLRPAWLRLCVVLALLAVPTKMELLTARLVLARQALPALRRGRVGFALRAPLFLLGRRARMMALIAAEAWARLRGKRTLLKTL